MLSDLDRPNTTAETHTSKYFFKSGDHTQPVSQNMDNLSSNKHLNTSISDLQNNNKNCQYSENDSNMDNIGSLSTSSTLSSENLANLPEDEYYVRLLRNFQPVEPPLKPNGTNTDSLNTNVPNNSAEQPSDTNNHNTESTNANNDTILLSKPSNETAEKKSLLGEANKKFVNICQMLDEDTVFKFPTDDEMNISKLLHSKDFCRDLNLYHSKTYNKASLLDDLKKPNEFDNIPEFIAKKRARKARASNSSSQRSKLKDHEDDEFDSDSYTNIYARFPKYSDEHKHGREGHNLLGKYCKSMKSTRESPNESEFNDTCQNLSNYIDHTDADADSDPLNFTKTSSRSRLTLKIENQNGSDLRKNLLNTDVLEALDSLGGIKYESGLTDLRRKYKSFERLCFGLGCTVPPTKQELEMCSQLSLLGDDSSLSQYETSVYQSCLLRSRSFESIWTKFCNRVIEIIRKYTLQSMGKLLKIINQEKLVEPFLKVVLINLGNDRQDQQLLISVLQEELNHELKDKYLPLKLNLNNNNSVDDIVNQMYIQMYQLLLLNSASKTSKNRKKDSKINKKAKLSLESAIDKINHRENLLDSLVKMYSDRFSNYELILIIDKINPTINDILYMFQMVKRRRLMRINSVLLVCSNNHYLETYCSSLIYSNLGIFECNMLMVSFIADDILQILLFDTKVQDFIPNFRMVMDIYDIFSTQDSSLTLMILRVYQLYELYFNKYMFSYLSMVPSFVFRDLYSDKAGPEERDIVLDEPRPPMTYQTAKPRASMAQSFDVEAESFDRTDSPTESPSISAKGSFDQLMLPAESLLKQNLDVTKLSDISTTTSLNSSFLSNKFGSPYGLGSDLSSKNNLESVNELDSYNNTEYAGDLYDPMTDYNKLKAPTSAHRNRPAGSNPRGRPRGSKKTGAGRGAYLETKSSYIPVVGSKSAQDLSIARSRYADEEFSSSSDSSSATSSETLFLNGIFDNMEIIPTRGQTFGDTDKAEMLERAKRLYSVYSLLSISNNMSDNYVAYLELKLVVELDLQKVVLELLPLNALKLFQKRILFQLGMNLLYKMLVFLPDSYTAKNRMTHILSAFPIFSLSSNMQPVEDMEKPVKDLLRRLLKYVAKKCSYNSGKNEFRDELKNIISVFNCHYKTVIQTAMDIQVLLDGGKEVYESEKFLNEMRRLLDENMVIPQLVNDLRHKFYMCFFPFISSLQLSNLLMLQSYSPTFSPQTAPKDSKDLAAPSLVVKPVPSSLVGDLAVDSVNESDIIMYIYKYIRYRIINMWKLFIIYYYIATSKHANPSRERCLVEVYVKFNVNIELLEKIYKVVLLCQTTGAALTSKDSTKSVLENKVSETDVQLCYLIKNSLCNINVKFL